MAQSQRKISLLKPFYGRYKLVMQHLANNSEK
jgi:hypothetical protein